MKGPAQAISKLQSHTKPQASPYPICQLRPELGTCLREGALLLFTTLSPILPSGPPFWMEVLSFPWRRGTFCRGLAAQLSHPMMRGKPPPCPLCSFATAGLSSQLPTFLDSSLGKKQVLASLFRNLGQGQGCFPSFCPEHRVSLLVSVAQPASSWT